VKRVFTRLPIRRKLFLLIFTTSMVVVLLASTAHFINDYRSTRALAFEELNAQVQLILDNAETAVLFDDPEVGKETVDTLQAIAGIRVACLYDEDRRLFATYYRERPATGCPEGAPAEMAFWESGLLVLSKHDVTADGRPSGALFVRSDQTLIQARLRNQVMILGAVLVIALAVATVLSAWLQRIISAPIARLAETAASVSARGDYSIRAQRTTQDEIGVLVDAFNRMLETIQTRERDLSVANEELRREVVERRRAEQLKDEFLATLSHELRTPLNAILGWTRLLRGHSLPDASVDGALEKVERNAKMQARLVDDLLEVSRITTGKLRIEMRPLDLVALARSAVESIRPAAESRGVTVERDLSAAALPTIGDPDRLQQVIWNLLSNAVKFTPAGGVVRVSLARRDKLDELVVEDNGIGIEPAFLPDVFDSFRQADASATRAYGGLGLGLSIVKQLVDLHGGEVSVESQGRDQGARFVVRLPVRSAISVSAPAEVTEPIPAGTLTGATIIVVDDDPDTRELLRSTLEMAGAAVDAAASADEALALCRGRRVDAIVSDIGMPGRDGYSLIEEIRAFPTELQPAVALALSAYASPRDIQRSLDAGFQEHVAKPVDPGVLVHTLRDRLRAAASGSA
jgi:signal transduction histidine kinase/ActR/RegA family two-component response regulator